MEKRFVAFMALEDWQEMGDLLETRGVRATPNPEAFGGQKYDMVSSGFTVEIQVHPPEIFNEEECPLC